MATGARKPSATPTGGPVFPLAWLDQTRKPGEKFNVNPGVSYRDYAALQILISLVQNADPKTSAPALAAESVLLANALVAETTKDRT